MYVDSVTLAALADELNARIVNGRVQAVVQTSALSIGLEVYAGHHRHYLVISAEPKSARCLLSPEKLRRGVEQPVTLTLLLRKYVEGARLLAVSQPPWERILHFDFSGPEGDTRLIAEIMDQRSNIILTVEGDILDSIKRIGPEETRYRVILPRRPYVPPPPQEKALPDRLPASMIADFLGGSPESPAWRALVEHVAGISPLLAREVIFRACEEAQAPAFDVSGEIVGRELSALVADFAAHRWSPCIVPAPDGGCRAFAAYELRHLGAGQPAESISAAMAAYFSAPAPDPYAGAKQTVARQIEAARRRIQRKLAALDREAAQAGEIELLRKQGELLLAYGPTLKRGQAELRAQYDPDGPELIIPLDPLLSHVENARRYFDRYDKAKRAASDVPALRQSAEREAAYLDQLAADLDLAENWPEIDLVREELQRAGYWQGPKPRGPKSGKPGLRRIVTEDGFVILVGRSAEQNHNLVTLRSRPADLWLHARGRPGGHVIVRNDGRPIPEAVIQRAAELAAYYSTGRDEASLEVDVTQRRYVRPIKGGRPGQVTYKNERVLAVKPWKG